MFRSHLFILVFQSDLQLQSIFFYNHDDYPSSCMPQIDLTTLSFCRAFSHLFSAYIVAQNGTTIFKLIYFFHILSADLDYF